MDNFIQDILKTDVSIYELYKKLYSLDLHGMKESELYKKNLDYLTIALGVEKEKYNNAKFDIEDWYSIFNKIEGIMDDKILYVKMRCLFLIANKYLKTDEELEKRVPAAAVSLSKLMGVAGDDTI